MAISRSYPRYLVKFCEKKNKKSILPPFLKNTQFFMIHLFLWFAKDTFSFHLHHSTYPPGYPPGYPPSYLPGYLPVCLPDYPLGYSRSLLSTVLCSADLDSAGFKKYTRFA